MVRKCWLIEALDMRYLGKLKHERCHCKTAKEIGLSNIIALIWDCDKTLIDGYMQDPIFADYKIDSHDFWTEVNTAPERLEAKGMRVNHDTYYLNAFIRESRQDGKFAGLNNEKLREYGAQEKFYPGVIDFFKKTKSMFRGDNRYSELGVQVENYIVSTGFAEVIRGSELYDYVDGIWGCELLDTKDSAGNKVLGETIYTIDNTTKTRALFEINKGIGKIEGIDVNSKIAKEDRRVQFENMIYIADGPSDIPAFSVVNKNNGSTFAIYPHGDMEALSQVEKMREDGRINMYAEANYEEDTTANMWLTNKIEELATRIRERENNRITSGVSASPKHLV